MADEETKDDTKNEEKMIPQSKVNEIVQNRVAEIKTSLTTDFDTKLANMTEQIGLLTTQKETEKNKSMSDKETAKAALKTAEDALAAVEEWKTVATQKDEQLAVSKLNSDDTQALIAAGFGPEGAELLLGKLVEVRQVIDGKTFYKSGESLTDRGTIIGGLTEQFSGLINANRAKGQTVTTKDVKVDLGKQQAFTDLLNKKDKTQAETVELYRLANEIKQEKSGD